RSCSPSIALPVHNPLGNTILDVLAVGAQANTLRLAGSNEEGERFNYGAELHPVISCGRLGATLLVIVAPVAHEEGPSAGARISDATAVGENLDHSLLLLTSAPA